MGKRIYLTLLMMISQVGWGIGGATADPTTPDDVQVPATTSPGQSAARVYIDPKTRKPVGPPPGIEPPGLIIAEQNRLSRSDKGLEKRQLPDGTSLVNLQGRFQNMTVVNKTPDGKSHMTCKHSVDGVEHSLLHASGDAP
jgi:hypothetical protein